MDQENYVKGCSMKRPPLLEPNRFCFWKARFETYVKSKDIDLWQVIQNTDFYYEVEDSETKLMKETSYELLEDDQKKKLGKNNEAKMTLYNALPRKEYERVFMCKTAKEFSISNEETIDSVFTRFNAIVSSLKSLDPDYSSKNHVRKFLHSIPLKWRSKVTTIKEAKDLATLPLNELIGKLKVYEMVLDNDGVASKTTKETVKLLALKAKGTREKTSDDNDSQGGSDEYINEEEEAKSFNLLARNFRMVGRGRGNSFGNKGGERSKKKGVCYNCGIEGHFASECRKPKENKAFVVSKASSSNIHLNIIDLQKENEELLKFNKDFAKTFEKLLNGKRSLKNENSKLLSKVNEFELEVKKLANTKEVFEPCQKCVELTQKVDSLRSNVSKFQDEALNLSKFKKSSIVLDDMLSRQKFSQDKEGLGFSKNDKTTSASLNRPIVCLKCDLLPDDWIVDSGCTWYACGDSAEVCLKCDLLPDDWIVDSGCTKHMTGNRRLFTSYTTYGGGHVVFGSNQKGKVVSGGNITHDSITITNVEHVSGLDFNLINVGQLCDDDCVVSSTKVDCTISINGKTLAKEHRRNGLYTCKLGDNSEQQICLASVVDNSKLWYRRLGHANMRLVQNVASNELVRNLPKLSFKRHFCDTCGLGSQGNANNRIRNKVSTTRVLELLHLDLFGPSLIQSYRGNFYCLMIVDDHLNYTWVVFVESKDDILEKFKILCKRLENLHDCSIVSIVTNHSSEFDKLQFGSFCEQHEISYNLSGPFTSQSSEIVERTHRKLRKISRAMLDEQSIPQKFWCHALDTTTYIFNRESLNVTFDESLPEPKSSPLVEDDMINEPIVQDLNGSPSLQVNALDEGYPRSLKEARDHPIEQVIGELNERTLRSKTKQA
ncbi:retrovirus-related pol polyprotein from transposon TNT 1-94 [Tanacetum coccineum]|uniref:Retrovirus-related pol polyprotein from transposon TNT 1-94 n=1 Tax=Tanacetum coccineum TaxID=301880 RepID=A0ABQ5EXK9_9ASTR